jgi:ribose 5-phosphate isomerase B
MKIFIGADHNGFELKQKLLAALLSAGFDVVDMGDKEPRPTDDFPQFAEKVVIAMQTSGEADPRGILICGSGQGMSMAANRFKGIRASLVWDIEEARVSRNDDNSNVLCLPARHLKADGAIKIAEAWISAPFAGAARYKRRLHELDQLG